MNRDFLNILVISDLHCKHSGYFQDEKNTFFLSNKFRLPAEQHPVQALFELIDKKNLKADLVICPGDIAEKIDYQGLITGWSSLQEIKLKIGADLLVASTGNHDVNTHKIHPDDVFFSVKSLSRTYPCENIDAINEFWSNNFCLIQSEDILILNFNSVWNFTSDIANNLPRIEPRVLGIIEEKLKAINSSKFAFKIAMCHHHPIHYSNIDNIRDTDWIDKGEKLITLLEKYGFQIFIHGHKHDPKLTYTSNDLPLLCAGSFSSLTNVNDTGARNVFHLIKLVKRERKGTIVTYEYSKVKGWVTKLDSYFPCFTGFGHTNIQDLARDCADWFEKKNKDLISFSELEETYPSINFLNPDHQYEFNKLLKEYNKTLNPEFPNKPKTISILIHE